MENQMDFINITIQDHTGDRKLRLSWDTGDTEAAKLAQARMKEMFEDLQKENYRFFTCKKVLGIFPKKGREVNYYDPKLGELFYEASPNIGLVQLEKEETKQPSFDVSKTMNDPKVTSRVVLEEIPEQEEKMKYEEPKKFDPKKDNIDTSRNYVATRPMRAG